MISITRSHEIISQPLPELLKAYKDKAHQVWADVRGTPPEERTEAQNDIFEEFAIIGSELRRKQFPFIYV